MIVAWFMRYGSLELQTFGDIEDLADQLNVLDDCESCIFDQWGIFKYAENGVTGLPIPDEEIEEAQKVAAEEQQRRYEAEKSVTPKVRRTIYITDGKGRKHPWRSLFEGRDPSDWLNQVRGLGDRVVVIEHE